MSDPAPPPTAGGKAAPPPRKRGKIKTILFATLGLATVGGGSAGAAVYLTGGLAASGHTPAEDPSIPKLVPREGADEAAVASATAAARRGRPDPRLFQASYVTMEDGFTSNLAGTAFVQVGIGMSTYYDERVPANVEKHKVAIRSAVLVALSEQDPSVLATSAGKQALRRTLARAINQVLVEREGFGGIDDVHFTGFVMQ